MIVNHNMITTLVERWRPETNTFHFTSIEDTITWKDVAYIYGLPINWEPVVGVTYSKSTHIIELCEDLVSIEPLVKGCSGLVINFSLFH